MARTVLKHKTALILGAESPAGRAVALQLSREGALVVLAGHDARRLQLLAELIKAKGGSPAIAELSQDRNRNIAALLEARDESGNHYHFLINALASVEPPADMPGHSHQLAHEIAEQVLALIDGKGSVRVVTIWPGEGPGPAPHLPPDYWHSVVRMANLEMAHDEAAPVHDPLMVKAAGAADALVYLLSCPPSACPVEVRLEPRSVKV